MTYELVPIGVVESDLADCAGAPFQGSENAPTAVVRFRRSFLDGMRDLAVGDIALLLTWLHLARRDVLRIHPRADMSRALTGVFSTRSQDRPNPIGLHRITITDVGEDHIRVSYLEAIDGTPVLDLKPVLIGE